MENNASNHTDASEAGADGIGQVHSFIVKMEEDSEEEGEAGDEEEV